MDSLVKINIGAAPNDGTGDPARDAFAKHNQNMDSIANALGAASGIATLGADGRLPPGQAPAVQTLPATAHDLNNYQLPGSYRQASTAGAQAGTNYPQATGGILSVEGAGVSGQTVQRYTVASTGAVSPTAGARQYWRMAINTSWSPWQEVHTAGNSLPYLGRVEAGADLNNYANRGMWAIAASSTAAGGTNFPIANSGWLLVYCEAAAGAAAGTNVNQVYIGSNGNRQFFRSLVGGNWSAWEEVVRSSLLGALNGVATLDGNGRLVQPHAFSAVLAAGSDANVVVFPGFYYLNSDAQASAALNWPVVLAGTLQVEAAGAGNLQITQTYTTRNGSGGVVRTFKRVRFGTAGTWGTWQEVARLADTMQHGQCRFVYSSPTACALLPYNGNGLIINGRQYRIPAGGITFPNTGLAANGVYYVFAKDDGAGGITMDAIGTGTTTRSTHTDGVEIRTGDPTRTLVGMIVTSASSQFFNNATTRGVASWFNRRNTALFEVGTNSTTAATSYVKLTNGVSTLMWFGDAATVDFSGIVVPNAVSGGAYLVSTVNGTSIGGGYGYSTGASGNQQATGVATSYTANADAYYNFAPYGLTSNGAISMTFKQDFRVMVDL